MLRHISKVLVATSAPFIAAKCLSTPPPPKHDLPKARVAIIGAGVGGCSAAYFLRELGGKNLEIHVFSADGRVGGRADVVDIDGHLYESGGSVIHTSNKYLVDMTEAFGLTTKGNKDLPTTPMGIFNGKHFAFQFGSCSICNKVKALLHFGISLIRLNFQVGSTVKRFATIYKLQSEGQAFSTVQGMLKAMGGENMYQLTQVTTQEYCNRVGYSQRLVDELVTGALRNCYGQNTEVNAFTALIALTGIEDGSLWSVVGGNKLIPQKALEASHAVFRPSRVQSITRNSTGKHLTYAVTHQSSQSSTEYDIVIIAHPLNVSRLKFNNFPTPIYTAAATTPFQRTVATFVKGELDPTLFNLNSYGRDFPFDIFTTASMDKCPVHFRSIGLQIPSEATRDDLDEYLKPISQSPSRVWKVFSARPLTEEEKDKMFTTRGKEEVIVDWLAYPAYNPPEEFPPFILDDGVFYINGIEKAASAMEMSAIGAKNVALLARAYLLKTKDYR